MKETANDRKFVPIPLKSGGVVVLDLPYPLGPEDFDWMTCLIGGLKRSIMSSAPHEVVREVDSLQPNKDSFTMEIQLCYLTSDTCDTIVLTRNGVVVSEFPVDGNRVSPEDMRRHNNLTAWEIQDEGGLKPLQSYGTLIAKRIQIGVLAPLQIIDDEQWKERREHWDSQFGR